MSVSEEVVFVDMAAPGQIGVVPAPGLATLPRSWHIDGGVIDEEHQSLLDLINEGWRSVDEGGAVCVGGILPILASLRQRFREHFEHEETIMAEMNYPALQEHAARHGIALVQLCSVELRVAEARAVDRGVLHAMLSALIDDVLRADIPFKTFLQESGRIR